MIPVLRWLLPSVLPALLVAYVVYRSDRTREPIGVVLMTFLFGVVGALGASYLEAKAATWTGLSVRASVSGEPGALVFLFAVVAPLREASKVAATWPAFLSKHFDEPYDGIVYASAAALGFSCVENAMLLRANPDGLVWVARALLALPAHLFFACSWGYALGRAKQDKTPGRVFPVTWLGAVFAHGFYAHFVHGRGPAALLAVGPLLVVMAIVAWLFARDLAQRGDRPSLGTGSRLSSASLVPSSQPRSLRAVREALLRVDQPVKVRWVAFGMLVTLGAIVAGLVAVVLFGRVVGVDFSVVDERDVGTTGPVALLGSGILAAFPASGWLIARSSGRPGLVEPAIAVGLALVVALLLVGMAAPVAVVFALAFSPVALGLACAGAWVGRPNE